jgi:hypothetical protein
LAITAIGAAAGAVQSGGIHWKPMAVAATIAVAAFLKQYPLPGQAPAK